jgi:hypothetical protein
VERELREVVYAIYQIPDFDTPREYFLGEGLGKEDVSKYRSVWGGRVETDVFGVWICEGLFRRLNIDHPEGYRARSLSCGDVIGVSDGGVWSFWYCARIGFEEVTALFGEGRGM